MDKDLSKIQKRIRLLEYREYQLSKQLQELKHEKHNTSKEAYEMRKKIELIEDTLFDIRIITNMLKDGSTT